MSALGVLSRQPFTRGDWGDVTGAEGRDGAGEQQLPRNTWDGGPLPTWGPDICTMMQVKEVANALVQDTDYLTIFFKKGKLVSSPRTVSPKSRT
jgi:hypothetical protein